VRRCPLSVAEPDRAIKISHGEKGLRVRLEAQSHTESGARRHPVTLFSVSARDPCRAFLAVTFLRSNPAVACVRQHLHDRGKARRKVVGILQDDGAHAVRLRLARFIERIERARAAVGMALDVNVDRPQQRRDSSAESPPWRAPAAATRLTSRMTTMVC
jgi:hypothetical protein